ncbi:MAG: hypothetical protein PHH60_03575 [Candidatus Margulisbacteria bacterium]|nr:hypothetical protein [Candidatus Margulisiibacteriota bacterium]
MLHRISQERAVEILGKKLQIRQSVLWAGAPLYGKLYLERAGNQLRLVAADYKGGTLDAGLPQRALRFINSDLELVIPEIRICGSAKEWLEQAGARRILKVKDLDIEADEAAKVEIEKGLTLHAAVDLQTAQTYVILALNT